MSPIYDYECSKCGQIQERYANINSTHLKCRNCGGNARRIISASGVYTGNDDADWLKSVREVVGTETKEGRDFIKDPSRTKYKAWMRKKGLRPMDSGEKSARPDPVNEERLGKKVLENYMARNRIEVR